MKKIYYLITLLLFISIASMNAQVRIGSQTDPHQGAVLDLKSNETATKGLLLPNVNLSDVNTFQLAADAAESEGMMIYNTNETIGEGVYIWDGEEWTTSGPVNEDVYNEDGSISKKIGKNTYGTYQYGDDIWMTDNSREGTPQRTSYGTETDESCGAYYNNANKNSACPTGWHVPSRQEAENMLKIANNLPDDRRTALNLPPSICALSGQYGEAKGWNFLGTQGTILLNEENLCMRMTNTNIDIVKSQYKGLLTMVRCVQDK